MLSRFALLSRIDQFGSYHSPNICFIEPDEDDDEAGGTGEAAGDTEGSDTEGDDAEGEDTEGEDGDDEADGDTENDDAGEEGEGDDEEPPPRDKKPSRGANLRHRAQEAERLAKEAKDEAAALRRDLEGLRGRGSDADRARLEAEETARVATMTPDEKIAYYRDKDRREYMGALAGAERRVAARNDKVDFNAYLARHPKMERFADQVETRFNEALATGGFITRENILRWVLGDAAMKGSPKASNEQRRTAAARRQRETAKPSGGRSDVQAQRGKKGKTAADRLRDVTF